MTVDRLSVGGRGVARHDGAVLFIDRTAPNERVQVRVSLVKKNYAEAELIKVLEASPARVNAPCPYYEVCGGCNWQHVSYPEQLSQKTQLLEQSLRKFSGFSDFTVLPCIASPQEFRYRNRVQVHIADKRLGFYKRNSHQIVDINDCIITDERITKRFSEMRKSQNAPNAHNGRYELKIESHERTEIDMGFSQVNSRQNETMQRLVCELGQSLLPNATDVFDLYCGNGNLTLPLAETFSNAQIVGVEYSAKNIAEAKLQNASIQFYQAKVEDFLLKNHVNGLVVLDPPRSGCEPSAMEQLARQKPEAIIYVSCHPVTLARDLKFLSKNYDLKYVQPLDMFPQTDHVECVVGLVQT